MTRAPVRVVHLITGLGLGGTEIQLALLLAHMDPAAVRNTVVSLTPDGEVAGLLRAANIAVHSLGMRRGRPDPAGLLRLWRLLRDERPDVLQTWLYHADLLGLAGARLARTPQLAWNLRCSVMDERYTTGMGGMVVRLLARFSAAPDVVVTNSEAGRRLHERLDYRPRRWAVLPNGFDLDRFRPDAEARAAVRRELGLAEDAPLIGLIARRDPVKGHDVYLRAAALLAQRTGQPRFLLAGAGVEAGGPLAGEAEALGLAERTFLLGPRTDVPALTAALDIATCASSGEGFPNVVGEAMACGVPVVTTDVGDAAAIVGDCGRLVAPGDPAAMADAWAALLALDPPQRKALGAAARARIAATYEIGAVARRYADLYCSLAGATSG